MLPETTVSQLVQVEKPDVAEEVNVRGWLLVKIVLFLLFLVI
jgi:hypothetical protein